MNGRLLSVTFDGTGVTHDAEPPTSVFDVIGYLRENDVAFVVENRPPSKKLIYINDWVRCLTRMGLVWIRRAHLKEIT